MVNHQMQSHSGIRKPEATQLITLLKMEVSSDPSPFSREQMEALQKLLQQTLLSTAKPTSTAKVAQKGNFSHALNTSKGKRKSWIVDSRASYHMTGNITVFNNYSPCHDHSTVQITDGTLSKVVGKGSVVISEDITLNSVLYVPKLDCNLLSISKLTSNLNCH